ncbi:MULTISPECIES: hypothetical protein [Catenuloplanes]|uniref:Uncharacterized protein n=1 Tax=Catenuloplanes niger TaxID=587534 RepID=A0AAE3ZKS4_9ACTN|nr:hypothetical protein [Catenuloplanes niger]MDR7321738.1 hypothetical protein [Catenuloplanes niger]
MSEVVVDVSFTALPEDDDFVLDQLTDELAEDLSGIGEASRLEAPVDPQNKGVGELVLSTVAAVAGTDPGYAQALVDLILGFLNRNQGRRAHLKVGDVELTIDQPTKAETSELIDIVRGAIERSR